MNGPVIDSKIGRVARGKNPGTVVCQLANTNRSCIAEGKKDLRMVHEQHSGRIPVEFIRQEYITQLFTAIECAVLKFCQRFWYIERQQTGIGAEGKAADTQYAERNFEFCCIRHLGQCLRRNIRMRTKLRQALLEIRTFIAHFQSKQTLLSNRLESLFQNGKQRLGGLNIRGLCCILQPVDIDFHRAVQNNRQLHLKSARNCQAGQIRASGKRHLADFMNCFRNTETDKRIAVHECVFREIRKCTRQSNLLILTRCRAGERTDISD